MVLAELSRRKVGWGKINVKLIPILAILKLLKKENKNKGEREVMYVGK